MVYKHGLLQCQIGWNIAARYTIGSEKTHIVTYVGKNTCFLLCLFKRKKVEYIHISSCLLWQAKDLRWVEWPFSHHYFYYLLIFFFKILCSRENSPKLSLSAKTHGDSAIWVISEKHHISLNEEHLELLQDLLKLFRRKWLLSKM